jgi:acetyltransferase-like isoleucine patch superfamily enzyme
MNGIKYILVRIVAKLTGKGNDYIVKVFRKDGIKIGNGTHIFSNIITSEPYLIEIGENTTISTNVSFITHDASVGAFLGRDYKSDLCGKIIIGNNCFVGNNSILLYGISLPDRTLVASGSVVTKSFAESGCILGGNPARVIGHVDVFLEKNNDYFLSLHGKSFAEKKRIILQSNKLITR